MKRYARNILGKYSGLECPDAISFSFEGQAHEQRATCALTARRCRDIDAYFGYTAVHTTVRDRTERRPSDDGIAPSGGQSAEAQMIPVPSLPVWGVRFESRVSGCDAFKINGPNLIPVIRRELVDCGCHDFHCMRAWCERVRSDEPPT